MSKYHETPEHRKPAEVVYSVAYADHQHVRTAQEVCPKEAVATMVKEGTPDLEHIKKWAQAVWRVGRGSSRTWTVLSIEERKVEGASHRIIGLLSG